MAERIRKPVDQPYSMCPVLCASARQRSGGFLAFDPAFALLHPIYVRRSA